MTPQPIRKIVILGGGTSGWSAAACLAKFGEGRGFDITVVDSSSIGTVGVGEASVPNIRNFNAYLGLTELDFIESSQGTFKLGIEFIDWQTKGTRFFHPFGRYGVDLDDLAFHQCLAKARRADFQAPLEAFSLPIAMAKQGRFAQPIPNPNSPLSDFGYAYHFDAAFYGRRLKRYAMDRGVKHLNRHVRGVDVRDLDGQVAGLIFEDDSRLEGELFIDCSGFRALLIEGALKTGYDDWSHWLPCDRAVAIPCHDTRPQLEPYTRATAREAGWTWRIPLQHRVGNGYVYCSAHLDDSGAIDTLVSQMDSAPLAEPNLLRFVTGNRKQFWNKNCVALGLASGFIEPLESTSINLVHRALSTLMEYFPDTGFDPRLIAVANRRMRLETENIRDFIILHYKGTQRQDTAFWRQCSAMPIPDSLQMKMDAFHVAGHLLQYEAESFKPESWLTIYEGLGMRQEGLEPLVELADDDQLIGPLMAMQKSIAETSRQAMLHGDFIKRFCPAIPLEDLVG